MTVRTSTSERVGHHGRPCRCCATSWTV